MALDWAYACAFPADFAQNSTVVAKAAGAMSRSDLKITFFKYGQSANTFAPIPVTSFFSISFGRYNVVTAKFPLYPEMVQVFPSLLSVTTKTSSASTTTLP